MKKTSIYGGGIDGFGGGIDDMICGGGCCWQFCDLKNSRDKEDPQKRGDPQKPSRDDPLELLKKPSTFVAGLDSKV